MFLTLSFKQSEQVILTDWIDTLLKIDFRCFPGHLEATITSAIWQGNVINITNSCFQQSNYFNPSVVWCGLNFHWYIIFTLFKLSRLSFSLTLYFRNLFILYKYYIHILHFFKEYYNWTLLPSWSLWWCWPADWDAEEKVNIPIQLNVSPGIIHINIQVNMQVNILATGL